MVDDAGHLGRCGSLVRVALACILLSGCFVSADDIEGQPEVVARDVEFWREPQGPGSYSQCQTDLGFHCDYRLRLCANGVMNIQLGDVLISSTYHLEGSIAVGESGPLDVRFDLDTLQSDAIGIDWMPIAGGAMLDCSAF